MSRRDLTIAGVTLTIAVLIALIVVVATGGEDPQPAGPAGTTATVPTDEDAARAAIQRTATAYQRALDPKSTDDPCRYLTPDEADHVIGFADPAVSARGCEPAARVAEKERARPLYPAADEGLTDIVFLAPGSFSDRPVDAGAQAKWRADSTRTVFFAEQKDGRWLITDLGND